MLTNKEHGMVTLILKHMLSLRMEITAGRDPIPVLLTIVSPSP